MPTTYLVTGGAGFIGSNFARYILDEYDDAVVVNVDALTYAGNLANIEDLAQNERHVFVHADICDEQAIDKVFAKYGPDYVVNFAAESSVDRSIESPASFTRPNVEGLLCLLDAARRDWEEPDGSFGDHRFLQVSTDEVFGMLPLGKHSVRWKEGAMLAPRNPYSASKAAAELSAMAFADTYGLPVNIARCCNNFGPAQFPEKLVPKIISSVLAHEPVMLYGDGSNIREWIYVTDCCSALDAIVRKSRPHKVFNVGTRNDSSNLDMAFAIIHEMAVQLEDPDIEEALIGFSEDRKGHDLRYGLDASKITKKLGWKPRHSFEEGIRKTVAWYLANPQWLESIETGEYRRRNDELLAQWGREADEARSLAADEKERAERKSRGFFAFLNS